MPGILDKIGGDLAPTATYARRSWEFIPGDPGEGLLTIILHKGKRAGCKVEVDTYQIQEQPAVGSMGREFLLLNIGDEGQPDVYRCLVGGLHEHCTCTAGNCRVASGCKHRHALAAVIEDGGV